MSSEHQIYGPDGFSRVSIDPPCHLWSPNVVLFDCSTERTEKIRGGNGSIRVCDQRIRRRWNLRYTRTKRLPRSKKGCFWWAEDRCIEPWSIRINLMRVIQRVFWPLQKPPLRQGAKEGRQSKGKTSIWWTSIYGW